MSSAIFPESIFEAGVTEEWPLAMAARIGSRFEVEAPLEAYDFSGKGNINLDTFWLTAGRSNPPANFLLQRINQQVFTRPRTVMDAMLASLDAQRRSLAEGKLPPGREWEVITLLPTRDGNPYLEMEDRRGSTTWRLMVKIGDCTTHKSLSEVEGRAQQLAMAEEVGKALALYGDFTADMDVSKLVSPLPGYRDTAVYYAQFQSILDGHRTLEDAAALLPLDPVVRAATEQHFLLQTADDEIERRRRDPVLQRYIELACEQRDFALTLSRRLATGAIRTTGIHGDTKLENFLISTVSGQAKALVDLDTVLPHTWLSDWGDMLRSLTNVAGEKERDPERVRVDMEIYAAVARGFLSMAREVTAEEIALMVDAVEIIALELGVRFLADYLRGDSYFKLSLADPKDLNRTRAIVQLTLFERLRENRDAARRCIDDLLRGQ